MTGIDVINTKFMTMATFSTEQRKGQRPWQSKQGTSKIPSMVYYLIWDTSILLLFSKYHRYVLYTLDVHFSSKEIYRSNASSLAGLKQSVRVQLERKEEARS